MLYHNVNPKKHPRISEQTSSLEPPSKKPHIDLSNEIEAVQLLDQEYEQTLELLEKIKKECLNAHFNYLKKATTILPGMLHWFITELGEKNLKVGIEIGYKIQKQYDQGALDSISLLLAEKAVAEFVLDKVDHIKLMSSHEPELITEKLFLYINQLSVTNMASRVPFSLSGQDPGKPWLAFLQAVTQQSNDEIQQKITAYSTDDLTFVNRATSSGKTILHVMPKWLSDFHIDKVRLLLGNKPDFNQQTARGNTPLHVVATQLGKITKLSIFKEYVNQAVNDVDFSITNKNGKTFLDLVLLHSADNSKPFKLNEKSCSALAYLLESAKQANRLIKSNQLESLLYQAIQNQKFHHACHLLKRGDCLPSLQSKEEILTLAKNKLSQYEFLENQNCIVKIKHVIELIEKYSFQADSGLPIQPKPEKPEEKIVAQQHFLNSKSQRDPKKDSSPDDVKENSVNTHFELKTS